MQTRQMLTFLLTLVFRASWYVTYCWSEYIIPSFMYAKFIYKWLFARHTLYPSFRLHREGFPQTYYQSFLSFESASTMNDDPPFLLEWRLYNRHTGSYGYRFIFIHDKQQLRFPTWKQFMEQNKTTANAAKDMASAWIWSQSSNGDLDIEPFSSEYFCSEDWVDFIFAAHASTLSYDAFKNFNLIPWIPRNRTKKTKEQEEKEEQDDEDDDLQDIKDHIRKALTKESQKPSFRSEHGLIVLPYSRQKHAFIFA